MTAGLRLGNKAVTPVTSAWQPFPLALPAAFLLPAKASDTDSLYQRRYGLSKDVIATSLSRVGIGKAGLFETGRKDLRLLAERLNWPDGFSDHATDGPTGSYTKILRRVQLLTRGRLRARGFPRHCCRLITSLLRICNEVISGQPLPDWTNLPGPIHPAYATGIISDCRGLAVRDACSGIPRIRL